MIELRKRRTIFTFLALTFSAFLCVIFLIITFQAKDELGKTRNELDKLNKELEECRSNNT